MIRPRNLRVFLLSCLLLACFVRPVNAQLVNIPYGWTSYASHSEVIEVAERNGLLYAITRGGLFWADPETRSTFRRSTVNGLSGITPTTIYSDPGSSLLFIGYADGSINTVTEDDRVGYISDIQRTTLFPTKTINRFVTRNNLLFIATEFGIVVFDTELNETRLSVTKIGENTTGLPVPDISIHNNRLYAVVDNRGLYSVDLNEPNISLPSVWIQESGQNSLPVGSISSICSTNDRVYTQLRDTIYQREASGEWVYAPFPFLSYVYLNATEDRVYAAYDGTAFGLLSDGTMLMEDAFAPLLSAYVYENTLYAGSFGSGLIKFDESGTKFYLFPPGPINNYVTDLAAGNGELYIAPRGKNGSSDRFYDKSGIPYYSLMSGGWKINDHRSGILSSDSVWQDFARAIYDDETGRAYIGSFAEGIVVMENGAPVKSYMDSNSGLQATGGRNRVSGLGLDEFGNLWVTQLLNDFPIHVLTPEGEWFRMKPMDMSPIGLTLDDFGTKWINNYGNGIIVYHDNYTPGDPSDDKVKKLSSNPGQGGLISDNVLCMTQDLDQQMWIGTSVGVTIYYDPSILWTDFEQDAACPIIEGFCLLRDQRVNDIAVDAANRKWIGTEDGVYLVNADGTELLQHYTVKNSPLFDNAVRTIAIDQSTGEVFFGTALGTVSIIGDAIMGRPEMADSLYAFPNPVPVDYGGKVFLKNMDQNSSVKIANVAGQVVRELQSNGGEVPWDLQDAYGNRVPPGIYIVMISNPEGESTGITKLAVIERQN